MFILIFLFFAMPIFSMNKRSMTQAELAALIAKQVAEATQKADPQRPVFLNINSANYKNEQTVQTKVEQKTEVKNEIKYLENIKKGFWETVDQIFTYVTNNKIKTICIAGLSGLTYANIRLMFLKNKLTTENTWAMWQSGNLEELYRIPQKNLSKNLLNSVQKKYINLRNISDFTEPLNKFLEDTNNEVAYLNEYENIINIVDKFFLKKLLFYDANFLSSIPERRNKLLYIKSCLINWLIEYKTDQAVQVNL